MKPSRTDARRQATIPSVASLLVIAFSPARSHASDAPASPSSTPIAEVVEHRFYVAPGAQFGSGVQELSLSLGRASVSENEPSPDTRARGGDWVAGGLRISGVAHAWSPAAVHLVVYASFGTWGWEWWPFGVEAALGVGRASSSTYGLLQLSYVVGITSRLEAYAAFQAPLLERPAGPEWPSRWLLGLRVGFDLSQPRRERVTRVFEQALRTPLTPKRSVELEGVAQCRVGQSSATGLCSW